MKERDSVAISTEVMSDAERICEGEYREREHSGRRTLGNPTFRNLDSLAKEREESDKQKKGEDSIILWKLKMREF